MGDNASAGVRTVQDLVGTVFMFPDQFADYHHRGRVEFHRMNSPFYAGEKWCVRLRGDCLNHDAEWEWELSPSNRDAEFYARCRFDTLDEAVTAYNRSANAMLSVSGERRRPMPNTETPAAPRNTVEHVVRCPLFGDCNNGACAHRTEHVHGPDCDNVCPLVESNALCMDVLPNAPRQDRREATYPERDCSQSESKKEG